MSEDLPKADCNDTSDAQLKSSGRNRICKQCKFSCTDSKEFFHHQMYAHSEESESTKSSLNRRSSFKSIVNIAPMKRQLSQSNSTSEVASLEMATLPVEKMNGHVEPNSVIDHEDEKEDEGRLVIAEDEQESEQMINLTPLRSGNIQNRTYMCNLCEFSTTSAKTFLHHQKENHNLEFIIYECDICEYATKYKQKLPRHRKLHFTGKDSMLGSDLDISFSEMRDTEEQMESSSIIESITPNEVPEQNVTENEPEVEEDEMDEVEEEEETSITKVDEGIECQVVVKKKKTRQEVDPSKYFEVFDDMGVKFACSKCGNVYKWRKSLNKHWKEKHFGDIPNHDNPPPGLTNYSLPTPIRNRSSFGKTFGNGTRSTSASPSTPSFVASHSRPETPQSTLVVSSSLYKMPEDVVPMPKIIGPFITHSSQPLFPVTSTPVGLVNTVLNAKSKMELKNGNVDKNKHQALDFSKPSQPSMSSLHTKKFPALQIKEEPRWDDEIDSKSESGKVPDEVALSEVMHDSPILQCSKCAFVAKTLVDYSSHMTLHLNKRAFKCAECQEHFNGVDDLNRHFSEFHADKISQHKEAIQKIPHGLQQTYHLLKMPLKNITSISSQELTSSEPKQLQCNMCSFIAKWPAELQKHAVSHSEERPFMCMVCGSTYKWKWDLVKHFEKSHHSLPNPYKRREQQHALKSGMSGTPATSPAPSLESRHRMDSTDQEPSQKKRRLSDTDLNRLGEESFSNSDNNSMYLNMMYNEDGPDGKTSIAALESLARPSSEPMLHNDELAEQQYAEYKSQDLDSAMGGNFFDEDLDDSSFASVYNGRPINSETQKAVINAVRQRMASGSSSMSNLIDPSKSSWSDVLLPYKCPVCEYRARWPSEITQHMKNHSDEKPFHCPRCNYKSKWKWDVVKHMKRCGGGTIKDVIDTSKSRRFPPPNVTVMPQGNLHKQTPQPVAFLVGPFKPSSDDNKSNQLSSKYNDGSIDLSQTQGMFSPQGTGMDSLDVDVNQNSIMKSANTMDSVQEMKQQMSYNSIINQGQYQCMECSFMGTSPAELRRHTVMHSESKPFTCRVCGYSSRWKCDLKKHMRTYEHDLEHSSDSLSPVSVQDKFKLDKPIPADSAEKQDHLYEHTHNKTLYKCSKCPYVTYKKNFFSSHLRIHGDKIEEPKALSRFRCKQCDFHASDLPAFLQHKVMHSNSQQSTVSTPSSACPDSESGEVSTRTIHLKHRRKPVKQFQCSKCPYVCFKKSGITLHEAMHEPRGNEAYMCMYCDYNVYSKSLLLQHMRLHSEYNPTECVEFIKIDGNGDLIDVEKDDGATEPLDMDEEEYIQKEELQGVLYNQESESDRQDYLMDRDLEIQNYMDGRLEEPSSHNEQSQDIIDLTESALDLSSSNKSMDSNNPPKAHTSVLFPYQSFPRPRPVLKLPCEWCDLHFPNITTLYSHSKNVHPIELRDQEIAEAMRADLTKSQFGNPKTQKVEIPPERYFLGKNANKNNANQPNHQKQLPQPIHSMLFGVQEMRTSSAGIARTSTPILSTNAENQKSLQQFSRNMSQHIERPTAVARPITKYQEIQPAPPKLVTNLQSSNLPANKSLMQPSQMNAQSSLMQLVQKARKTTSPQKRSRSFQCTKCSFTAPNAVTYLRHIERHGSKCKHTCRYCDYSIDRLNLLYQHMKGTHGDLWKGTAEEKISMSTVPNGEEGGFNTSSSNLDTSNEGSFDNIDDLIETVNDEGGYDLEARSFLMMDGPEDSEMRRLLLAPKGKKPVLIVKEETTWRGVPVHICTLDGRKNYKCPKCSYISSNAANTTNHVRQHGGSRKYICDQCDYSVDNLKLIYHHMETVHPPEPLFIEVDGTTITEEMDGMSDTSEMNTDIDKSQDVDIDSEGYFACPRCPYRVKSSEVFQRHLEMHEYNGCHQCKYCDYSIDKYNLLLQHQLLHEQSQNAKKSPIKNSNFLSSPSKREITNRNEINAEFPAKTVSHIQMGVNKSNLAPDKIRYKCLQCPYNTFYKKNIIKHRKQHLVKNRFRCPHCNYSALREFLLRQHLKFHGISSNQELNKGQGGETKKDETVVNSVKNVNSSVESDGLNSETRNERISPKADKNQNKQEVHAVDQISALVCQNCPYIGTSASEFHEHCSRHDASYRYACDYCSYSLDELNPLYQHRKLHCKEPDFEEHPDSDIFLNENFIEGLAEHENLGESLEEKNVINIKDQTDESIKDKQLLLESLKLGMKSDLKAGTEASAENSDVMNTAAIPNPTGVSGNEDGADDEKLRYSCSICPYRCNALKSYKCHIAMHETPRKYICDFCNWSADRLNLLYQHRKVHGKESSFRPNPGELVFLNREFVMETESVSDQFNDSNNNSAINGSMQVANSRGQSSQSYSCKLCPFISISKNLLAQHRNCHRVHARYTCNQCSFSVDRWNSLAQHMKLHKTGQEVSSPGSSRPRHHCKKCPYHSSNRNLLELHETMHASGKKHICTYCDYSIDRFNLLQQHMRVHTQYSQNKTVSVKKTSPVKSELKVYDSNSKNLDSPQLYFESQEDPENGDSDENIISKFKCERCPFSTSSKEEFDDHELKHNVQNKHTCLYCDYSCQEKNQLIPHVQVHFPGTPMNVGSIKQLVTHPLKPSGKESDVSVLHKHNQSKDKPASEPDSTVVESTKTVTDKTTSETNAKKQVEPKVEMEKLKKTKIYVCQYCEREFEGKASMLQHEKQHLIGASY